MKIDGHDGIKTLIFDFGGVFVDLDIPRCVENFRRLGFENVGSYLTAHLQSGFFGELDRGEISSEEFRNQIRAASKHSELTDAQIDGAWTSMLDGIPKYKLEFAKRIKPNFERVVLLSNINEIDWHFAVANFVEKQGFKMDELFDRCYLSYEMKVSKPDPLIFHKLLEQENLKPDDAFLFDDALVNCEAATKLGIRNYRPQVRADWRAVFS